MDDEHFDPELAKRAKEEAAGPLGQELSKFPLRFALTALFGKRPVRDQPVQVNHGTITLLELGSRRIGLPCSHVLDQYREISHDNSTFFQIGREELNPLERMIDESRELDLVSIDLNDILIEETIERLGIVTRFFVPQRWPPNQLKEGDFVAFGGFPGKWREHPSWDEITFETFSSGACPIAAVRQEYFVCQFERQYWVESFNYQGLKGMQLDDIRGLSGGPVFIHRNLFFEFVGIIYEFSSGYDLMRARPAQLMREDGTFCAVTG